jgi:hypothetical protein
MLTLSSLLIFAFQPEWLTTNVWPSDHGSSRKNSKRPQMRGVAIKNLDAPHPLAGNGQKGLFATKKFEQVLTCFVLTFTLITSNTDFFVHPLLCGSVWLVC